MTKFPIKVNKKKKIPADGQKLGWRLFSTGKGFNGVVLIGYQELLFNTDTNVQFKIDLKKLIEWIGENEDSIRIENRLPKREHKPKPDGD